MKTFEIYLVFTICALGTLLSTCNGFDLELFTHEMLKLHNVQRNKHGANDLIFDNELFRYLINEEGLQLLETNGRWLAPENVNFLRYSSTNMVDLSAENVFSYWYNERQNYDYTKGPTNLNEEHFTQIVWKDTQYVCFGLMKWKEEHWFIAAYYPAGNHLEQYFNNVQNPEG